MYVFHVLNRPKRYKNRGFAVEKKLKKFELTEEQQTVALELAINGETITAICDQMLIGHSMFYRYRKDTPAFSLNFEQARQEGLEKLADELITMADDVPDVQRARLKSDNYKWLLSKRKPMIYGDRVDIHVTQTIDINAALDEARSRVNTKLIDVTDSVEDDPTD